jgi:hypothetical protein
MRFFSGPNVPRTACDNPNKDYVHSFGLAATANEIFGHPRDTAGDRSAEVAFALAPAYQG